MIYSDIIRGILILLLPLRPLFGSSIAYYFYLI